MSAVKLLENISQIKPGMEKALFGDIEIGWDIDSALIFDSEELDWLSHYEVLHEVLLHLIENASLDGAVSVHFFLVKLVELNLPEIILIDLLKKVGTQTSLPMYALRKNVTDIRKVKP